MNSGRYVLSGENLDSTNTQLLLKRVLFGDREALNRLFEQHRPYLRRLLELRMAQKLKARVDPSDVVQETQIEVARRSTTICSVVQCRSASGCGKRQTSK